MTKKTTILIASVSSAKRSKLGNIFKENFPCIIMETKDGIETVKQYKAFRPNLVLMDVDLPKVNGIIALDLILQMDPKAKVIMISSDSNKGIKDDAIGAGALNYITLPLDINIIRPILIQALH